MLREAASGYAGARVPVRVVRATGGAGPSVLADSDELRRVLANLVDNAVRHAATRVEVSAAGEGPRTLLRVTDDGPGIPEGERERVFERFTRLDDARDRDVGGSGLGLAIVRELVTRNQGTVGLTDPEGTGPGLCAEVRLPR